MDGSARPRGRSRRAVGGVVVGGDFQGLGIVHSLGRRGVPVCVVDDEYSMARFSRYASHSVRVRDLRDEATTADVLLRVGSKLSLEGWVLYPTREETVAALSHHRDRLGELFRVPTPSWECIRWAWDKRNTYRLAADLGIPTPRTWYPEGLEDLHELQGEVPLAIKPAIKEHFIYATKAKAWRANTARELLERFRSAAAIVGTGELMVQEIIPGDGHEQYAYCAFFKKGRSLGSMMVRRRRQHPPEFGRASTFVETVDVPELRAMSERLLRSMDYYGLAELEYKRDPRDGTYKLLDVNARTWGYHSLGRAAGVDFPYLLFSDQCGEPPQPCQARVGVGWVRLITDLPTAAVEMWSGRLSVRGYVKSLRTVETESVFAADDPLPALVELALLPHLVATRGF